MTNSKTLHLTNAWHPSSGGVATFYKVMLEAAEQRRRLLRLVVPSDRNAIEDIGRFARLYHVKAPRSPLGSGYRVLSPHHYLLRGSSVRRILEQEHPDVVEICDKYTLPYLGGLLRTGLLAEIIPRPVVIGLSCERMDDTVSSYLPGGPLLRIACRIFMRRVYFPLSDHHIAVSDYVARELAAASVGHVVDRGVWIAPMGVDCRRFRPGRGSESLRRELIARTGGGTDATLLFYAGRLAPEKNLPLLIETARILREDLDRDYRLVVAGDGSLRRRLARQAAERLGDSALFLGHIADREQLADLYGVADVFLHTNPREPFGIAPLEAMAAGLPLVAPDRGGLLSYANRDNAWLTEPSPAAFAAATRAVLADPVARRIKTAAARAAAERACWEKVVEHYFTLYEEILARTRGCRRTWKLAPAFSSSKENIFC